MRTIFLSLTLAAVTLLAPMYAFSQKQTRTPKTPYIEKIKLEDDTVNLWCPFTISETYNYCKKHEQSTRVVIGIANPTNDLEYYYSVTGGRIIGKGPDVKWDFDEMRPGEYKITVSIGRKGIVIGEAVSKTVRVNECPICDPPCECTNLTGIDEPKRPAKTGDVIVFTAHTAGRVEVDFKWTVEGGVIISSADEESIQVKVTAEAGSTLRVLVEIEGNNPTCGCNVSLGTSILIAD